MVVGTERRVKQLAVAATRSVCKGLEARDLIISQSKRKITATTAALAKSVAGGLKEWNSKSAHHVKNLGVDYVQSRSSRRRSSIQSQRVHNVRARARRFRSLKSQFRRLTLIARAGAVPAGSYGTSILGISNQMLGRLRGAVGLGLFGPARGRSRTIQYWLSRSPEADPSFVSNSLPVLAWGQDFFIFLGGGNGPPRGK